MLPINNYQGPIINAKTFVLRQFDYFLNGISRERFPLMIKYYKLFIAIEHIFDQSSCKEQERKV